MTQQHLKQIQKPTLAGLLSEGQWATIDTLLAYSTSASTSIPIDDPSLPSAVTSDIIVHFAARFQAPLRIITLLARLYPESLSSSDAAGRYPVHVASKWGATPDVVQFLIKSNPAVAGTPDNSGKTPMHYVAEFYVTNYTSPLFERDQAMLYAFKMLKIAAPTSVNLEDDEGMNAIEYALGSDANFMVIKAIQRACRDDWRDRSKASVPMVETEEEDSEPISTAVIAHSKPTLGRRRHRDLVKDIQIIATVVQSKSRGDGEMKFSDTGRIHLHSSGTNRPTSLAARTA